MCGSFGKGSEGQLLACAQCAQCYHPYCVNSKVIIITSNCFISAFLQPAELKFNVFYFSS